LAHRQHTNRPYNLPEGGTKLADKAKREGGEAHCPEPRVRKPLELAGALIDPYDHLLGAGELSIPRTAPGPAAQRVARLPCVPGIGPIVALVMLYESQDSARFPRVPDCRSDRRRVKCAKESAGTRYGRSGQKIGPPRSRGPSRQPPRGSCARISWAKKTAPPWHTNPARAKRGPCWPSSGPGPGLSCSRGTQRLTSRALGLRTR
jgi:hypothetical protein